MGEPAEMIQSVIADVNKNKLRYLIDADGFHVNGVFLVKELAVCDMLTQRIVLHRFRVGKFNKLPEQTRKQVVWLRNNIHGLDFIDGPLDAPQSEVDTVISTLAYNAHKNNELIGYKGGQYELDMLSRCGYGFLGINIELFGCPRLDILIAQNQNLTHYMCTHHRPLRKKSKVSHCPQMEVMYFMVYLMKINFVNRHSDFYEENDLYSGLMVIKPTDNTTTTTTDPTEASSNDSVATTTTAATANKK